MPATDDIPEYFTTEGLAKHCEITTRSLFAHIKLNVGQIQKAREKVPGLRGNRYTGSKCRKYIAQVTAGKEPRRKQPAST